MLSVVKNIFFKKIELWLLFFILIVGLIVGVLTANLAQKSAVGANKAGYVGKVAYGISRIPDVVADVVREVTGNTNRYAVSEPRYLEVINEIAYRENLPGYIGQRNAAEDEFKLIRLSDGSIFKKWENLPNSPRTVSLYDDTLILGGTAGKEQSFRTIEKYNQKGERLWQAELYIHHTLFVDSKGYIYSPIKMAGHDYAQSLMPEGGRYRDDGYAILDPDGNIVETQSVTQILIDNDLGHLIFGVGPFENDAIHLNAIKVAEIESEYWEVGDLLMSARHLSLVFLYRPSNGKIIWHQTGPWLNQHDPDFLSSTEISVFGNDMVSTFSNRVKEDAKYIDGGNNIYVYDFAKEETSIRYREVMDSVGLATVTSGSHHIFDDGSLFVWFSNTGISILYDDESEFVSYFGHKHDETRIDRQLHTKYIAEPINP